MTWPGLFRRAFEIAFKPGNIIAGFRSCGIFPWNLLYIPSAGFAPVSAFDTNKPDTNEHPLQWVIRRSFETESRVEEVTVVRQNQQPAPKLDVSLLKSLTPSCQMKFKWTQTNRISSMFQEVQKIRIICTLSLQMFFYQLLTVRPERQWNP
ncbi:unnamed protein product [Mytilus edulis]|uniref:Uncharacterized protein n=1 Tax=Mytilus edulis TaxID=6550 RepID=A0A8S3PRD4_MYTED|nr:unnamed protein product [Mytilus edulis]